MPYRNAAALAVLATVFAGHLTATGQDTLPEDVERVLTLPPGPGNPRNSEGDFVQLKDGRVLFVYTHFTGGGGDHDKAFLAGRCSEDGGRTWPGEDTAVLPNEGGMNIMSVSLLRLQSGPIALFYLRKNATDDCLPVMRISTDEAQTWSEPVLCIGEPVGYYVVNNARVVQLKSGRLVVPAARHALKGEAFSGRGTVFCALSDDDGKTWRLSEAVPPPEGVPSALQEPGVIELKTPNHLMMLSRGGGGCQWRSYSEDGGETWSPVEATQILSPVSPASFERIPSTGDILLVWNNHEDIADELKGRRTPYTVALSKDDGETWTNVKNLETDPYGHYCYTAIHFVEDAVLLGSCAGDRRKGGLSLTRVLRFDVGWLYE